jgi:hypothetical protein
MLLEVPFRSRSLGALYILAVFHEDADPDITILKEAKAESAKSSRLQQVEKVLPSRSLFSLVVVIRRLHQLRGQQQFGPPMSWQADSLSHVPVKRLSCGATHYRA